MLQKGSRWESFDLPNQKRRTLSGSAVVLQHLIIKALQVVPGEVDVNSIIRSAGQSTGVLLELNIGPPQPAYQALDHPQSYVRASVH